MTERESRAPALVFFLAILSSTLPGGAQNTSANANSGLELSLYGATQVAYGDALRMSGVAYQVQGYAELRPIAGAEVVARLRDYDSQQRSWEIVETVTVRSRAGGVFDFALPVPERRFRQAQLQIEIKSGGKQRAFEFGVGLQSPLVFDLLLDRNRYEPGETVHVWSRLHRSDNGAPESGRTVHARVTDPSGRPIAEQNLEVGPSGATTLDVELPDTAADGVYSVDLRLDDSIAAATQRRTFQVARRTVERVLVETTLDQDVVVPSGQLTGRVRVTTPSGAPISGAAVQMRIGTNRPVDAVTDGQGIVAIRMLAPAYLAGDVQAQTLQVRVNHAAHGTLHSMASFLLSRVEWRVSAIAANSALVPEVDSEILLSVTNPRGDPAPGGTKVKVSGGAVRGGSQEVEIDEHGLARVAVRVADGDAGPLRSDTPGCSGISGVRIDVEVQTERPAFARVCIAVNPRARVRPSVTQAVVEPGSVVEVDISRHPEVRGRPVLVEALASGRAIAAAFASGNRARVSLPSGTAGVVQIRARPLLRHDARHPLDQPGGSSLGTGAMDAVLVRPGDAFGFELVTEQETYRVRQTAQLGLRTTQSSPQAWAALVARDLAAHGGETPFTVGWMHSAISAAAAAPNTEGSDLLLRSALVRSTSVDTMPRREPPLVQPYWRGGYPNGNQAGTLRDPVAARDRMRRRQVGQLMIQLERWVSGQPIERALSEGVLVRRGNSYGFDPNVIANMLRGRHMSESQSDTLGGDTSSLAMIRAVDPSFSFDAVAKRIARSRLVTLMMAISRFSNPDDANAARASQGQPPERWLSRMVQLGVLRPNQLLDPWGHPFEFRRSGSPRLLITDRAPNWELVSAGPDGRFGSRDDIRDPFTRLVAEGTPYAVVSGEDQLMKALSTLAPGPRVLNAMASAYASMSLQAREEQRARVVSATTSEDAEAMDDDMTAALQGVLGGAAAAPSAMSARGRSSRASGEAMAASPAMDMPSEELAEEEGERDGRDREQNAQQSRAEPFAAMNTIIRERFPATLHFVGEVALDGNNTTVPLELADALTTYRIEAIAWTGSGWLTTANVEVKVDQEATVDAPTPPFGTVGDGLRLPIRVGNRTSEPLEVKVVLEFEGTGVAVPQPVTLTVPPRGGIEETVEVQLRAQGEGTLLIRALRALDDTPLDAIRRPLTVWSDARLVRIRREILLTDDDGASLEIEVPADATARGPGELRIVPATAIFGDLETISHPASGWALALVGETPSEALLINARSTLRAGDPVEEHDVHGPPAVLAMAMATLWNDATVQDVVMRRAMRSISRIIGDASATPDPGRTLAMAEVLSAIAPCLRGGRPQVSGVLQQLSGELRRGVGSGAVAVSDAPIVWSRAAAALALVGGAESRSRELLRRTERHVVRLENEAFLEAPEQAGMPQARLVPTAVMAIAWAALGERARGMKFLRHLVSLHRGAERWDPVARVSAAAAAGLIAGRGVAGQLQGQVDGAAVSFVSLDDAPDSRIRVAVLDSVGQAGAHRIRVQGPSLALVFLDIRYGRPWDAAPERSARLDLEVDGPLGPRDARAGLALTVRNRSPRLATAPVIELDLPAGTELDEPTRAVLREVTVKEPTVEGRTLQLHLRPLAPGGRARIPLPLRWSVGGNIRGLGVSAYDDGTAPSTMVRPLSVLPSRALEITDEGTEPEQAEAESTPVPRPPPPPPPLPRPVDALGPVAFMITSYELRGAA